MNYTAIHYLPRLRDHKVEGQKVDSSTSGDVLGQKWYFSFFLVFLVVNNRIYLICSAGTNGDPYEE